MKIDLWHGDCLEKMKDIPDKSVDMILTDPPYGTTQCKWDNVIPFEPMWIQLKRIIKDRGAICLFGIEPFSSHLRMSNLKMFKYDWVWVKNRPANINCTHIRPMRYTENILVFYNKNRYFPQMVERSESGKKRCKYKTMNTVFTSDHNSVKVAIDPHRRIRDNPNFVLPKDTLFFPRVEYLDLNVIATDDRL